MSALPVIDLSGFFSESAEERRAVAREWDAALSSFGMATIVGHRLEQTCIEQLYAQATDYFRQPLEEKMASCLGKGYGSGGYVPKGVEAVARSRAEGYESAPDLVENIVFSAGGTDQEKVMPSKPPELRPAVQQYWASATELLMTIMELSAVALELPPNYFEHDFSPPETHLRLAFYPELSAELAASGAGAMRYGAHTDYTGFTILRQDPKVSGLEVQLPSGEWLPVPPTEGGLVINAGDLIQVWTNDRWRSPMHRVVNPKPPADGGPAPERLSLVFFTGPKGDAIITALPCCCGDDNPARYPPVSARDHLSSKIGRSNV